jgi:lipopolysaccharide biosynthesis glycosyltransferase
MKAPTIKKVMTIASTIEKNYLLPLSVTAYSLLKNKGKATRIDWYVFESGVSEEEKKQFDRFYRGTDITFHWVTLSATEFGHLPHRGRFIPRMYQRLVIADFIPADLSTLLYLDADLLVLGDIEELSHVRLNGMAVGAVQDMVVPTVSSPLGITQYEEMGISPDTPNFNTGVLLMNLPVWRRERISERALSYIETSERIGLMDQDALNAILHTSWKPLHYRWNVIAGVAGRRFFKARHLDKVQYDEAVSKPRIVHFGGYLKPWLIHRLGNRWDAEYKQYLADQPLDYSFDTGIRANLYSAYDRFFRSYLYPLERGVWKRTQYA